MKKASALILSLSVLLASCGGGDEEVGSLDEGAASIDEDNKTLTIALGTDVVTFDIHDHNNTSTEAVHDNMFNYLFKRDENNEIQPELVESFEQVDELTVEMTLKEGVTFHNGDPLTSEDVKFTLERVATDDTLQEYPNYNQISEVEIIDDLTFRVITHDPEPSLFHRLSRLGRACYQKRTLRKKAGNIFWLTRLAQDRINLKNGYVILKLF
ncbi:ABC transporter substrate-binding protein [Bacillus sp. JCM 19041]|uniref:ABC transporter substrate-binding protein n=1 Tax=Bacillus sp. JCM 19041 TaxID=1460637 RepID=UPI000B2AE955